MLRLLESSRVQPDDAGKDPPFSLYRVHPDKQWSNERSLNRPDHDDRGQRILDPLRAWNMPVVELLDSLDTSLYTDRIHPGDAGQRRLAEELSVVLGSTSNTFARAPLPAH